MTEPSGDSFLFFAFVVQEPQIERSQGHQDHELCPHRHQTIRRAESPFPFQRFDPQPLGSDRG